MRSIILLPPRSPNEVRCTAGLIAGDGQSLPARSRLSPGACVEDEQRRGAGGNYAALSGAGWAPWGNIRAPTTPPAASPGASAAPS